VQWLGVYREMLYRLVERGERSRARGLLLASPKRTPTRTSIGAKRTPSPACPIDACILTLPATGTVDYEVEQTFTRDQLEKMKPVFSGKVLTEWIGSDGGDLVVDVLDSGKFWVQYDRKRQIYRCADKKYGPAAPFGREWRTPR
jgi:hypothetical protein